MSSLKKISIFGATGSIGQSTFDLILANPSDFDVIALSAHKNAEKLAEMCLKTQAKYAVITDETQLPTLKKKLENSGIIALAGNKELLEIAIIPTDIVVSAIIGIAGLKATFACLPYCKVLALANKESIVAAGEQILEEAAKFKTRIIPVDSEHSAIFQVFEESQRSKLDKIILTASGGPFRTLPLEEFSKITVQQALKHPNWDMGAKITIDCATLANKGLELIEAAILFNVRSSMIDVVVHPESIIHSLVTYQDGSTLAQLGSPDMRTAISYALGWPNRIKTTVKPLNLVEIGKLTFETPNTDKFPALKFARQSLESGQAHRIIFNTANEIAVEKFIQHQIPFIAIPQVIETMLEKIVPPSLNSIEDISNFDELIRNEFSIL